MYVREALLTLLINLLTNSCVASSCVESGQAGSLWTDRQTCKENTTQPQCVSTQTYAHMCIWSSTFSLPTLSLSFSLFKWAVLHTKIKILTCLWAEGSFKKCTIMKNISSKGIFSITVYYSCLHISNCTVLYNSWLTPFLTLLCTVDTLWSKNWSFGYSPLLYYFC